MSALRTAEILAVGTELLSPFRSDTNSLYLTARLNEFGIEVRGKAIVGDDVADLTARLRDALGRVDLVVVTGGLGPTEDDVTRDAVASVLGRPLEEDAAVLAALEARMAARGIAMPANNRRQAQVPRGATPLANATGSAPGLWIEDGPRRIVLLPGPPRELTPMFEAAVAPRLDALTGGRRWRRRTVRTTGKAESQVDEIAQAIYAPWRDEACPVFTTILASPGQVELHLSAAGTDVDAIDRRLDEATGALARALGSCVVSVDGRQIEEVVGDLLRARQWRLAVAESCTGGLVTGRLTEVPGSSAWFTGGVVAYANEVKRRELGVPEDLLAAHGAVSEPVALAMADGARARLGADIGVGVTGIAGPSGGSAEKPVGTVVVAVSGPARAARTHRFPGDRSIVRQFAVAAALDAVRRALVAP
jgi:nicotinamide-nucleotide amidase